MSLCHHYVTELVSFLVDSSKSLKTSIAVACLAETKVDKTLYYWFCGQTCYANNDCSSKQRYARTVNKLKWKPIVSAKKLAKEDGIYLPFEALEVFPLWAEHSRGGKLIRSPLRKITLFQTI